MKKTRHNKKRNTAVLYEVLTSELTKTVIGKDFAGKQTVLTVIKEFFKKGSVLSRELELYKVLQESSDLTDATARRLLDKVTETYNGFDLNVIFKEQNELLKKMHEELPKSVFTNFIPDYKNLASISQIFAKSTPIKEKVLLEQVVLERLSSTPDKKEEKKLEVIDNLTYNTFVKKFNSVYSESLLPEQKELISKFVMSFSDNSVELKAYMNEEVGRLRKTIEESLTLEEVKNDRTMLTNTNAVLKKMEAYKTKPLSEEMISEVLKIQSLAKEIQS